MLSLVAASLIVGISSVTNAGAAKQKPATAEGLYVLSAESGALDRVPGGGRRTFELVVNDPNGDVVSFTDRPQRRAGHLPVKRFVNNWARYGFKQDPPNAALVIADAPDSRDVLVVELINPHLRDDGGLAFRAKVLKGSSRGALTRFRGRADRRVAASFGEFSLFIDPSEEDYVVNLQLKSVANDFVNFDGFGIRFLNASISQVASIKTTGPADYRIGSPKSFRITPVGNPGSPGAPIDASITFYVTPNSGQSIDGFTQLQAGASGSMFVYRQGTSYQYNDPIETGTSELSFSWPLAK